MMNDGVESKGSTDAVVGTRTMEIAVGLGLFAFGILVVADSLRLGNGWAPDGPEPGFYPFYVGLASCTASGWIVLSSLRTKGAPPFVGKLALRRVGSVLLPSAAYVAGLFWVGMYLASAVFLIGFMHRVGRYPWGRAVPVSIAIVGCLFVLFELWLEVPLPKGPLEAWLGL